MNDTVLFSVVIAGALVLILGTAYAMDWRRRSKLKMEEKVPPGPISRIFLWISYGILFMTILFVIGAFAFGKIFFANLAGKFIMLYIIVGIIYRIARLREL